MAEQEPRPLHRPAGSGDAVWAMGSLFEMKLSAQETAGAIGMAEVTQPAGVRTPLHIHRNEAEVFFVLDGRLRYEADGQLHQLQAGSVMYLPPGVAHRFAIDELARILVFAAPGGLLELYRQVGLPADERAVPAEPDPTELTRWALHAPGFGLDVLGPPLDMVSA